MRQERFRDGTASQHAPQDAAAHPRQAKSALKGRLLAASFILGAIASSSATAATGLTLHGVREGVVVAQSGDGRSIAFGSAKRGVLGAVERIVGIAPRQIPCPAPGREAYITTNGMVTVFEAGRFVGWRKVDRTSGARCDR